MNAEDVRSRFWRGVFFVLLASGLVLTVIRFTQGLGAVTNLSDAYPWGLWVGFDVLCGVGLAAGGFTLTAIVYIFNVKRFHPIVRPTVLTAFLGYLLVIVALLFDLGRPWNLWHPLVMWNPRSVMFEVSWCVTLYTTVLALEFSGMVFEKLQWSRAVRIQRGFTVPLVIAGVLLSTLHQSSLGAFYLLVPGKLHPIWYSPWLPWLFFVSSICVGLAMVIFESRLSARAFGEHLELSLVSEVGRILMAAVAFFGVMRIYDLAKRGVLASALGGGYEAHMFQVEFLLMVVAPILILATPAARADQRRLYAGSVAVVLGFVTNRLNVAITGFESAQGGTYVPALSEVLITLMLVAIGFALFGLAVRYLPVYPEHDAEAEAAAPGASAAAVGSTVPAHPDRE